MTNKKMREVTTGFTIIEVVLVLAIAGLIFLMVFVALPSLQRSQRDTARRNDMSRLSSALTQYQANNNKLPASGYWGGTQSFSAGNSTCSFVKNYLNASGAQSNEFMDPDGKYYNVAIYGDFSDGELNKPTGIGHSGEWLSNDLSNGVTSDFSHHYVYIVPGARCDGEGIAPGSGKRNFAVLYRLEGAGTYCVDNQ